jgi:ubiquinone/menaquinone biosynthesis C-methylase UbiE
MIAVKIVKKKNKEGNNTMGSKAYFDQVANNWDTMRQAFFSEAVREKAYQVAKVAPGKLAADVGAGTGFITEGLLAKGLKVIAVDQSQAMLDEMKVKFGKLDRIEYRQGESEALPVDDNSVDYTFANMVLHHVESPIRAIEEMVRILKPGGRLVITDLDEHT